MTAQLIIKTRTPWKFWLQIIVIVAVSLFAVWTAYSLGYRKAGYDNNVLNNEQQNLQEQIYQLGQKNTELRNKYIHLQRSTLVDKQAMTEVDTSLHDLQDEILELKEEIAFYRGIVAPVETASGLNITSLKLHGIGENSGYHFKLVLTQLMKNDSMVKGKAKIYVDGILDGMQKQFDIVELSGGNLKDLNLKFKYFQNIEGDIVLPQGFVPSRVLIDLLPSGNHTTRIKKTFDWSDIVI